MCATTIRDILHIAPVPAETLPRRALLREDVLARLRDAIVDGTLAPGEQLRDGDLAAWLGVSRTPVREALLELGRAGLVRAVPGRSTAVAPVDAAAVRDAQAGDIPASSTVLYAHLGGQPAINAYHSLWDPAA